MISLEEKIKIIDKKYDELLYNKLVILDYIDRLNEGMEGADSSIQQNEARIIDIEEQIVAVLNERKLLTLQQ